jgi:hypothetical protein
MLNNNIKVYRRSVFDGFNISDTRINLYIPETAIIKGNTTEDGKYSAKTNEGLWFALVYSVIHQLVEQSKPFLAKEKLVDEQYGSQYLLLVREGGQFKFSFRIVGVQYAHNCLYTSIEATFSPYQK